MNISLYLDHQTWVHRLDARTKFLGTLVLFSLAVMFSDPRYLFLVLILVTLGLLASQSFSNVKRVWILLVLLFVYSTVLWPFFVVGQTPVMKLGSFVVTAEGLAFGIGMGLRP